MNRVPKLPLLAAARYAPLALATLAAVAALTSAVSFAADDSAAAPKPATAMTAKPAPQAPAGEPEHVTVQHVLIGFQGSLPGKNITRTKEEAEKLANEILAKARKGEDFAKLVKEYTDDAFPGIYGMANVGVQPGSGEASRSRMVKGFGDIAFSLKIDEIGMASYNPQTSPYGWHIIKRLK